MQAWHLREIHHSSNFIIILPQFDECIINPFYYLNDTQSQVKISKVRATCPSSINLSRLWINSNSLFRFRIFITIFLIFTHRIHFDLNIIIAVTSMPRVLSSSLAHQRNPWIVVVPNKDKVWMLNRELTDSQSKRGRFSIHACTRHDPAIEGTNKENLLETRTAITTDHSGK